MVKEVERSKRAMLGELLEVLDNLDRALDAGGDRAVGRSLLEGVRLVRSQFLSRLGRVRHHDARCLEPAVRPGAATRP